MGGTWFDPNAEPIVPFEEPLDMTAPEALLVPEQTGRPDYQLAAGVQRQLALVRADLTKAEGVLANCASSPELGEAYTRLALARMHLIEMGGAD